jgi:hypothetical protein
VVETVVTEGRGKGARDVVGVRAQTWSRVWLPRVGVGVGKSMEMADAGVAAWRRKEDHALKLYGFDTELWFGPQFRSPPTRTREREEQQRKTIDPNVGAVIVDVCASSLVSVLAMHARQLATPCSQLPSDLFAPHQRRSALHTLRDRIFRSKHCDEPFCERVAQGVGEGVLVELHACTGEADGEARRLSRELHLRRIPFVLASCDRDLLFSSGQTCERYVFRITSGARVTRPGVPTNCTLRTSSPCSPPSSAQQGSPDS